MATQQTLSHHSKRLLQLGLPLIGGHMAQFAIQITDSVMLGWYDVKALAAVVLGGTLFFVAFIFLSGFAMAVVPLVASAAAKEDDVQIRRTTRMAMWTSTLVGVLVLPAFLYSEPILARLGQPTETVGPAADYLRIAGLGLIPALLVMVLKSYLSALERTGVILWITIVAALVNALTNYALIFGNFGAPEMGVRGAAIASVMVQLVSVVACAAYAVWAFPKHDLFRRVWRPDWAALGKLLALGLPIGVTTLAEVGLFAASSVMMGWLGTIPLAAHGIALQLTAMAFMFHLGLSNAATIRVGQAWGREDMGAVRQVSKSAFLISGLFAVLVIVIYLVFAEALVGLYVAPDDPVREEVIAFGAMLMFVAVLFQFADAGQAQALGLLRGMHDTKVPMSMAAFSYWAIAVPCSYLLGFTFGYGGVGIWMGLVIGLTLALLTLGWRLLVLIRR